MCSHLLLQKSQSIESAGVAFVKGASISTSDGIEYSNIWKSVKYSKAKSYSIIPFIGEGGFIWLKKSDQKLLKDCPGKIFDLRKIDHRGNTSTVWVKRVKNTDIHLPDTL